MQKKNTHQGLKGLNIKSGVSVSLSLYILCFSIDILGGGGIAGILLTHVRTRTNNVNLLMDTRRDPVYVVVYSKNISLLIVFVHLCTN